MEYEFSRDPIRGGYHAKFSMEHELFSAWLVDEVADDSERLEQLAQCIKQAKATNIDDVEFRGREYLLTINQDEVCLAHNSSVEGVGGLNRFEASFENSDGQIDADNQEQDIQINDDLSRNSCGLDDFELMLTAWRKFLAD